MDDGAGRSKSLHTTCTRTLTFVYPHPACLPACFYYIFILGSLFALIPGSVVALVCKRSPLYGTVRYDSFDKTDRQIVSEKKKTLYVCIYVLMPLTNSIFYKKIKSRHVFLPSFLPPLSLNTLHYTTPNQNHTTLRYPHIPIYLPTSLPTLLLLPHFHSHSTLISYLNSLSRFVSSFFL